MGKLVEKEKFRVWVFPHSAIPYFANKTMEEIAIYDEGLYLGGSDIINEFGKFETEEIEIIGGVSLLYNINKDTSNPHLAKYGYIVTNIPGDAVLSGDGVDLPKNIEQIFPLILEEDQKARTACLNM